MNFLNYIKGFRNGKEANQLEKESQDDLFLADAIDGYDDFPSSNHIERIDKIKDHVSGRRILSRKSRLGYISIAMLAFLLIGGGYFILTTDNDFSSSQYEDDKNYKYAMADRDNKIEEVVSSTSTETETTMQATVTDAPPMVTQDEEIAAFEDKEQQGTKNIAESKIEPIEVSGMLVEATSSDYSTDIINPNEEIRDMSVDDDKSNFEETVVSGYGSVKKKNMDLTLEQKEKITNQSKSNAERIDMTAIDKDYEKTTKDKNKRQKQESSDSNHDSSMLVGAPSVPQPKIGIAAYQSYIEKSKQNLNTEECVDIHGSVILEFSVSDKGKPTDIKVVKSLCPILDREAIRLLKSGSDWTLSTLKGNLKVEY